MNNEIDETSFDKHVNYKYMNMGDVLSRPFERKVKIAIIDSGIDYEHPAFNGVISDRSYNASTGEIVADCGMDVIRDYFGHGTSCAGVLVSMCSNEDDIGAADNIELLVIKHEIGADGDFEYYDVKEGIEYAIEQKVDVISLSFGDSTPIDKFDKLCKLAVENDITIVCAAGNDTSTSVGFPAANENVISVGALEYESWSIAEYSNYGDEVDIMAPGTYLTAKVGGGYKLDCGTSLAAPAIAAVIARFYAKYSDVTYSMVYEHLLASSNRIVNSDKKLVSHVALNADTFLNGRTGKVKIKYMTEGIADTEQLFYEGYGLWKMPEPTSYNVVLDKLFLDEKCTEPFDINTILTGDITLYATTKEKDEISQSPYEYVEIFDGIKITACNEKGSHLIIPDEIDGKTVTCIGGRVFSNNSELIHIELPNSINTIEAYAFEECKNLKEIDIPDSVIDIDEGAFWGCSLLTKVNISENSRMKTIGDYAFEGCRSLQSIYMGRDIKYVTGKAFLDTDNMREIILHKDNIAYVVKDGILYSRDCRSAIYRPAAIKEDIILDKRCKEIDEWAFYLSNASRVYMYDGIEKIANRAFAQSSLNSVTIPESVEVLDSCVFAYCERLSDVRFQGNSRLRYIGSEGFYECRALEHIDIPDSVCTIYKEAFANSGLKSLKVSKSVSNIKGGAFNNCNKLAEITVDTDNEYYMVEDNVLFSKDRKTLVLYPHAKEGEHFSVPEGVTVIAGYAFSQADIVSVSFPETLTKIDAYAFSQCEIINDINLPESLRFIGKCAFINCFGIEEIRIPASVRSIGNRAFEGGLRFEKVTIDGNSELDRIGSAAFKDTWIETFFVPASVSTMGQAVFDECYSLKNVYFESGSRLTSLSAEMFCGTINLEEITFGNGSNLQYISARAFDNIRELRHIDFSNCDKLEKIGKYAFSQCYNLEKVLLPDNLSTIGRGAFDDCKILTKLNFPKSVKVIDNEKMSNIIKEDIFK